LSLSPAGFPRPADGGSPVKVKQMGQGSTSYLIGDRRGSRKEIYAMIGFRVAPLLLAMGLLGASAGLASPSSAARVKPAVKAVGTKTVVLHVTGMT
jgi:hypothetical protein